MTPLQALKFLLFMNIIGLALSAESGRILGGEEVVPHSRPYTVALFEADDDNQYCAGSILDEWNVLTAAHCLELKDLPVDVKVGKHVLLEEEETEQVVKVYNYTKHEGFLFNQLKFDVGILHLSEPIIFNEYAQPIELSTVEPKVGTVVATCGWGWTEDTANSEALLEVYMPVVSDVVAVETYPSSDLDTTHFICTDARKGSSTCNGDSGGPLVWETSEGETLLLGAVSFGHGDGCSIGLPVCFTSVPTFKEWIEEHKKYPETT